jgi:TonB-linked SusC/RagA family outer membrane protein
MKKDNQTYKILFKAVLLPAIMFCQVLTAQTENDNKTTHLRADGGNTTEKELVGSVSRIDEKQLPSYPDVVLSNSLQGKAAGLIVRMTNNGLGNNLANIYIRGLATNGNSQAIVIIDGIERPLDDLLAEEIETIEVLKDATAKLLYGSNAANGVLVITTKRGTAGKKTIRLNAETGTMQTTRMPQFLDAYNYATLYNEARANDGLSALYMPYQVEGYKNSAGANDVLYPNVDWYDYFLKKSSTYRKATLEAHGGHKALRYAVVGGYLNGGGFEKIGESPDLTRFNLRGNLDIEVNDYMNLVADVAGRMESRSWSAINTADFFNNLSGNYPNEYPLTIPAEMLGLTPDEAGVPYFGTSLRKGSNLLADMQHRGMSEERYITSQTNIGLDFNFNKYIKGLTASAFLTFDNYTYVKQELRRNYPVYSVKTYLNAAGEEIIEFPLVTKLAPNDNISATDDATRRTSGWRGSIGYQNSIDEHSFSTNASYRYYKNEIKGGGQDVIDCNYNLRLNYDFAKKYLIELSAAYMGNNRFYTGNKYFMSPAAGLGWILSNEDFLSESSNINFLKLKASYGVLGFSGNTDYLLHKTAWADGGTIALNEGNTSSARVVNFVRAGNPDLKWEKSKEFNIGVEGSFFSNRLKTEINYFSEVRSDIIGTMTSGYGDYIGAFTVPSNIGSVKNQGIDGYSAWNSKAGELSYRIGLNFTVSKNKLLSWNENSNIPEQDRLRVGKNTDAIFGLQSLGLFGKDININSAPVQKFGPYGSGDIAYFDQNGDAIIDDRDESVIGNSFPLSTFGIDLNLQYKNWGMYVLGTSELGVDKLLNNSYYWNSGDRRYSVLATQRYHETNNPSGIYPALTSLSGDNSYRNSDFWIENASFFRLKNIELSYKLNLKSSNISSKNIKFFVRGTNLFVLSAIKDLDPEVLSAGLANNPVTAYYTGGLSFTF